jgi:NADPH:quinone reductase-like Zn-dependent oxidoreductase
MKAAVYHRYGPPEVVRIEEVPTPDPKANELLIRVKATRSARVIRGCEVPVCHPDLAC